MIVVREGGVMIVDRKNRITFIYVFADGSMKTSILDPEPGITPMPIRELQYRAVRIFVISKGKMSVFKDRLGVYNSGDRIEEVVRPVSPYRSSARE